MRIHREGRRFLTITFVLFVIVAVAAYRTLPWWGWHPVVFHLLVFYVLFFRFFRNPCRKVRVLDDSRILAPADGTIVAIERVYEEEYFQEERMQVSIFMSIFNVHVNRYPVSGSVEYVKYHPGKFLVANNPKSSTDNERTTVVIRQGESGKNVLLRQIAGALAKRIICYARPGDKVVQGQDLGFIKFGSRVDVLLPVSSQISVRLGEKVKGNQTVIATW